MMEAAFYSDMAGEALMSGFMGVLSYGIGTILGFALFGLPVFWFVQDITQKKHTVLRNYPLIGRLRYFFE
jgi:hypothetical protein